MLRSRSLICALSICSAMLATAAPDAAAAQTCPASASWFTSPSFPAEIPGGKNADNCDFHQFAWQAFAAATQLADGGLVYESWMPDYGVFPASGAPTPWGQSPPTPCSGDAANATGRVFRVRNEKSATTAVNPNSTDQAFGGALYDQEGNAVWYEAYVNQTEYDFITSCQYYNQGCIQKAPSATALPAGSIEIKTAWRQWTSSAPAPSGYYVVSGMVDSTKCTPATFLLVGFHLVINTPLHPEFIWATFEHVDNAPDCTNPQSTPAGGWSFNNPTCTQNGQPCPTNVQNTNPTQVCRATPWGGGSTQNVANIPALNQSVDSVLASLAKSDPDQYGSLALWQNYEMTGNLWTVNGALPPSASNYAGSTLNANTTLETYAQNANGFVNCFTCHSNVSSTRATSFPGNGAANFSHLFKEAVQTGGCASGLPVGCPASAAGVQRGAALLEFEPAAAPARSSQAPGGNN